MRFPLAVLAALFLAGAVTGCTAASIWANL